jgi:hypothetical protein
MPWLRQRLRAVHANATDLARHLEIPPARVYEMIKGQRQFQPHEIAKAASFLKIGESQLLKLIEGAIDAREIGIDDANSVPWSNVSHLSVPLLRATLAAHGRWVLHLGREEGRVVRPEFARFSSTAFAIVVQDECNRPVYRARDRILIDPESPVSPGDDVVLSSESKIDAQETLHVIPGQLANMTEATWTLKQYANDVDRSFSRRQFPSAWKIISRFMRV